MERALTVSESERSESTRSDETSALPLSQAQRPRSGAAEGRSVMLGRNILQLHTARTSSPPTLRLVLLHRRASRPRVLLPPAALRESASRVHVGCANSPRLVEKKPGEETHGCRLERVDLENGRAGPAAWCDPREGAEHCADVPRDAACPAEEPQRGQVKRRRLAEEKKRGERQRGRASEPSRGGRASNGEIRAAHR